jgi:ribosomal protein S18 acetylase RimI-like enzyme
MPIVDPARDARIADYVAAHLESDYQKYLLDGEPGFVRFKVDGFCDASSGTLFGVAEDTGILALAKLVHLDWDTDCLGFKVAKLADLMGSQAEARATLLHEVITHARSEGVRLLTCRVAYDAFSSIHALGGAGFKLVDALNIFVWDRQSGRLPGQAGDASPIKIEAQRASDAVMREALTGIAMTAFQHSRLYNDPAFSAAQVETFYGRLVDSLLDDDEALNLVAWVDRQPAGFVLGNTDAALSAYLAHPLGYLWLIAVDPAFAGQGVGQALLERFLRAFSRRVHYIEVGTQMDNYRALNLYARNGLRLVSSLVTMHLWL